MKSLIVLWADRIRQLDRGRLRIMLIVSFCVNIGILIFALAELPIVPIRPLCPEGDLPDDYDAEVRAIEGPLASPYFAALERRFPTHMVAYVDGQETLFVTVAQALDRLDLKKQSYRALHDLLKQRLGESSYLDWTKDRVSVAGFKNHNATPNCELMRKFAVVHGEWSNHGPEPIRLK